MDIPNESTVMIKAIKELIASTGLVDDERIITKIQANISKIQTRKEYDYKVLSVTEIMLKYRALLGSVGRYSPIALLYRRARLALDQLKRQETRINRRYKRSQERYQHNKLLANRDTAIDGLRAEFNSLRRSHAHSEGRNKTVKEVEALHEQEVHDELKEQGLQLMAEMAAQLKIERTREQEDAREMVEMMHKCDNERVETIQINDESDIISIKVHPKTLEELQKEQDDFMKGES